LLQRKYYSLIPGLAQSLQRDTIIESSAEMWRAVIPLRRGVDLKLLASHDGLRDTVNLSEGWGKTGETRLA